MYSKEKEILFTGKRCGLLPHTLESVRYSDRCTVSSCRHQTNLQTSSWNRAGICSPTRGLSQKEMMSHQRHIRCKVRWDFVLSPHGPAALMTASGLKKETIDAMTFTQRGGRKVFTASGPWLSWFSALGLSGKPHGSTRMRCDTLKKTSRKKGIFLLFYDTLLRSKF